MLNKADNLKYLKLGVQKRDRYVYGSQGICFPRPSHIYLPQASLNVTLRQLVIIPRMIKKKEKEKREGGEKKKFMDKLR
jgi:hypothetical protein